MDSAVIWSTNCPAKLNLFLAVGPRDERGWHPLRTIFQSIDLFDKLLVEPAHQDSFSSNVDYLAELNTVTRSLEILRSHVEIPPLSIYLEKTIPAQSGLGGGSSDAAGFLRIVGQFLKPDLSLDLWRRIALEVGADVPFFLVGGRAKAEGYGESLSPLEDSGETNYLVVKPEVDCSTPGMFRALDALSFPFAEFPEDDRLYNDFERVMPRICRDRIEQLFTFGARSAGLSGSGSAVFAIFETRTEALTAKELLHGSGEENVWVCRSLGREESLAVDELT